MHLLLDAVEFGLMVIEPNGRIRVANRWLRERTRTPLVGQMLDEALADQMDPRLRFAIRECLSAGHAMRLSHAFHPMPMPLHAPLDKSTQRMRHAVDVTPVIGPDGEQRECLLQIRDMSEIARREQILKEQSRQLSIELSRVTAAQQELTRQSLRFKEMTRLAPAGLFETDTQGRLTYCNERAAEMLQIDPVRSLGVAWTDHLPTADAQRLRPKWQTATAARVRFAEELCLERTPGQPIWLRLEAGPLRAPAGAEDGYIGTITDVTEFHQHAQRIEYRANHDVLTGLFNRERFEHCMTEAVADAHASGKPVAVLFLDLNHFKPINDTHGHSAGDVVLKAVAGRLQHCMRGDDVVGRIGGDEFAVLIPNAPSRPALEQILGKLTRSIAHPIHIGTCHVRVSCSAGIALFPDDGGSVQTLLNHADRAMYQQKFKSREPLLSCS